MGAPLKHTITVELDLGDRFEYDDDGDLISSDPQSLEDQVVEALVARLMKSRDYSSTAELSLRVDSKIEAIVAKRITEIIDQPIVRYEQHVSYGQTPKPIGEPFVLADAVKVSLEKLVAAPPAGEPDRYNTRSKNMGDLINNAVHEYLNGPDMKKTIANAKATIDQEFVKVARDAVAKALTPATK